MPLSSLRSNLALPILLFTGIALMLLARGVEAQVIVFDHNDVLAGGITPGDAPGYPAELRAAGSYLLSSHLQPPAGKNAIRIYADRVTLNLGGFTLEGSAYAPGSVYGIIGEVHSHVTVEHGNLQGFTGKAIALMDGAVLRNLRIIDNPGEGIEVRNTARVENVHILGSGAVGLECRHACVISDVVASGNALSGIQCDDHCNIRDSIARYNGATGILTRDYAIVRNNVSVSNKYGLVHGDLCLVADNVVADNSAQQVSVGTDVGTSTNVVDDVQIIGDHELDPSACIGGLCL